MIRDKAKARAHREAARPDGRRRVDDLLDLADHLPRGDRALVEAVLRDGRGVRLIAEMSGGKTSTVSWRLRGVLRRLQRPEFRLVALRGGLLDPEDRDAAKLLFLAGRSCREVARRTGRPFHRVRRLRDAIRHLVVMLEPEEMHECTNGSNARRNDQ